MSRKLVRINNPDLVEALAQGSCLACGRKGPNHAVHILVGGDDRLWNVHSLCTEHRDEWKAAPPAEFIAKYPTFKDRLVLTGWSFDPLTHPRGGSEKYSQTEVLERLVG